MIPLQVTIEEEKSETQVTNDINLPCLAMLAQMGQSLHSNPNARHVLYQLAQLNVFFGLQQIHRGRIAKEIPFTEKCAKTWGTVSDAEAENLPAELKRTKDEQKFSAKNAFFANENSLFVKKLREHGGSFIGGPSGTVGRNLYMLLILHSKGLLSKTDIKEYLMGFIFDIAVRGHHSPEEVLWISSQLGFPISSELRPDINPIHYYEQFMTAEFKASNLYQEFVGKAKKMLTTLLVDDTEKEILSTKIAAPGSA